MAILHEDSLDGDGEGEAESQDPRLDLFPTCFLQSKLTLLPGAVKIPKKLEAPMTLQDRRRSPSQPPHPSPPTPVRSPAMAAPHIATPSSPLQVPLPTSTLVLARILQRLVPLVARIIPKTRTPFPRPTTRQPRPHPRPPVPQQTCRTSPPSPQAKYASPFTAPTPSSAGTTPWAQSTLTTAGTRRLRRKRKVR